MANYEIKDKIKNIKKNEALDEGKALDNVTVQYKEFTNWKNNMQSNGTSKTQEEYWVNQFSGEIPVLNIPTDYKRPNVQGLQQEHVSLIVEEELKDKIKLFVLKMYSITIS